MDHAEQRRWLIRQLLDEEPDEPGGDSLGIEIQTVLNQSIVFLDVLDLLKSALCVSGHQRAAICLVSQDLFLVGGLRRGAVGVLADEQRDHFIHGNISPDQRQKSLFDFLHADAVFVLHKGDNLFLYQKGVQDR